MIETRFEVRCEKCRYWDGIGSASTTGWCRRYPPEKKAGLYPMTSRGDWCGEFAHIRGRKSDLDAGEFYRFPREKERRERESKRWWAWPRAER